MININQKEDEFNQLTYREENYIECKKKYYSSSLSEYKIFDDENINFAYDMCSQYERFINQHDKMNKIVFIANKIHQKKPFTNCSIPLVKLRFNKPLANRSSPIELMKHTNTDMEGIN